MENKICIYAICKNEKQFIDKWLNSMSEADYIVVLDTGSTDGTFDILKTDKRITKVIMKSINPWRFDVARNESMKLVPEDANILMCTDFDEVLPQGWAQELRDKWQEDTTRGFYNYAWSHNAIGEPTDVFVYDKIHTRDYKWIYPVHEVLKINDGIEEKGIQLSFMLEHFPDLSKSRSSYFDLLKLSQQENPTDVHVQGLLAREYGLRGDMDNCIIEFEKMLKMPNIEDYHLMFLNALISLGECYTSKENYSKALFYYNLFLIKDKTYREPYFRIAELYNQLGLYSAAIALVEEGIKQSTRKYDWVERANTWIAHSDDILSFSYYNLNDIDNALKYNENALKHDPDNIRLLKNQIYYLKEKMDKID